MPKKIIDIFPPTSTKALKERIFSLPRKSKKFWGFKKKIITIIFLVLISTISLLHFVFSEVKIKIWPETEALLFEEEITADLAKQNMDNSISDKTIPAYLLEVPEQTASQAFPSSGSVKKESKAHGKIKIINDYSSSQTLIVNTRFQAPSENVLYFHSTKTVTVPAKGNIEVDVVAGQPGKEYNIGPTKFSIPGLAGRPQYTTIYGESYSKMEGGFKGDAYVVEARDLDGAKNVLVQELLDRVRELLKNKAGSDFVLFEGVTKEEIVSTSSSAEAGAETESFSFEAKVKSQSLVFKKNDLENFTREFIMTKTQGGKKIKESSLKMDYFPESINLSTGKIIFKLKISALVYSDFDISALIELVKKKSLKDAQSVLENQDQVKKIEIASWPPWIKSISNDTEKIKIELIIDPASNSP